MERPRVVAAVLSALSLFWGAGGLAGEPSWEERIREVKTRSREAAAQRPPSAPGPGAADVEAGRPYIWLQLRRETFQRETPELTRASVDDFLARLGGDIRLLFYQDNDAVRGVDLESAVGDGMLGRLGAAMERRRMLRILSGAPEVQSAYELEMAAGRQVSVVFKTPLYQGQVRGLLARLGVAAPVANWNLNPRMSGVWLNVRPASGSIAEWRERAARIARAHPLEVAQADVRVSVPVMRVRGGK